MPVKQIGKAISFFAIAGEQLCPDSSRAELCWVSLDLAIRMSSESSRKSWRRSPAWRNPHRDEGGNDVPFTHLPGRARGSRWLLHCTMNKRAADLPGAQTSPILLTDPREKNREGSLLRALPFPFGVFPAGESWLPLT